MANPTYPGVYIEEKPGAPAPIQGVSTSTLALVGFTEEGPVNEPTLVTSMTEFKARFGDFTASGLTPTQAHAFFVNGGQNLYVVRVVDSLATAGVAYIGDAIADEASGFTGDGSDLTSGALTLNNTPVEPGSVSIEYAPGVNVAAEILAAGDGVDNTFNGTFANFPLTLDSVTFTWTSGAASKTRTIAASSSTPGTGDGTSATINRTAGTWSLDTTALPPDNATNITVQYKYQGTTVTITDDGAGALTGAGTGTVDYATGDISVSFTTAPYNGQAIVWDYTHVLWQVDMQWAGDSGNNFRVAIFGTPGFEDDTTATFTNWTFQVQKLDADGVTWNVLESFLGLDFDTAADADFFPLAVNDENQGSDYVTVTDVGNTGVPIVLSGTLIAAENIGTGNAVLTEFTDTLVGASAHPTTVTITATKNSDSSTMTVTDDGNGNLIGDVGVGTNTIDYDTGAVTVTFEGAVINAGPVLVTYYSAPENDSATPYTDQMEDGSDGSTITASEVVGAGLVAGNEGLYALNTLDDLLLVAIPDFAGDATVDGALVDYCASRMDRFAILSTPEGLSPQEAINHKRYTLVRNSSYYAIYYPWVRILDPVTDKAINIPPMGHIAGVYARTDNTKNVGKAPAGVEDGALRFQIGLERSLTQAEVGVLNPQRVNTIVDWLQVGGVAVWGARTGQTGGEFGYIQQRRLFMFLEKSVFNATHVYVFENNNSALWVRIRLQITGFLLRLFQNGYFAGSTPETSFFVVCDATNNTPESIAAGELHVDVGVAPNKPAEFIVISFSQMTGA